MNIEIFKLKEKIKIASFKHRGNINAIVKELNLPDTRESFEFVEKVLRKLRKSEERNVSLLICNTLMRFLMEGYQQRTTYIQEMLRDLEGKEQSLVSKCCHMPVSSYKDTYICLKCGKVSKEIERIDKLGVLVLKIKLLEVLREEDKALVEFASKMGYTAETQQQPLIKKVQNVLYLGEEGLKELTEEEKAVFKEIKDLSPVDREEVIKRLETWVKNERSPEQENK